MCGLFLASRVWQLFNIIGSSIAKRPFIYQCIFILSISFLFLSRSEWRTSDKIEVFSLYLFSYSTSVILVFHLVHLLAEKPIIPIVGYSDLINDHTPVDLCSIILLTFAHLVDTLTELETIQKRSFAESRNVPCQIILSNDVKCVLNDLYNL